MLRKRQLVENSETYFNLRSETGNQFNNTKISDGENKFSITKADNLLESEPNSKKREIVYRNLGNQDELEAKLHEQVKGLTKLIQETSQGEYRNLYDFYTEYCESPSPEEITEIMTKFVEGTKPTYEKLTLELISPEKMNPWESIFLYVQKNPLSKIDAPKDPHKLLEIGKSIVGDLGFRKPFLDNLLDENKPGIFLDIEEREGKRMPGGFVSFGPYSKGKFLICYKPSYFETRGQRRLDSFAHEIGHRVHTHFNRQTIKNPGDAIFVTENTIGKETISTFTGNSSLEREPLEKYFNITGNDFEFFKKWILLSNLNSLYSLARSTITEIAMHTKGPEHTRKANQEAVELTRSELIKPVDSPTNYATIPHFTNSPGYMFSYFFTKVNNVAITHALREKAPLFSANTAKTLTGIMIGNVKPIQERVTDITGKNDFINFAINYFNSEYKTLSND